MEQMLYLVQMAQVVLVEPVQFTATLVVQVLVVELEQSEELVVTAVMVLQVVLEAQVEHHFKLIL